VKPGGYKISKIFLHITSFYLINYRARVKKNARILHN
jgi:hypothetical protein